jgi:protein tyrosine/serine phosphatase
MNPRLLVAKAFGLALFITSVSVAQEQVKVEELPNLSRVDSHVYRGGQPKEGGLARLKQLGIKTVINLREADDRAKTEAAEATSLGLRYFNIALPHFERPNDATISQLLTLITSSENQPVFVHCKRGSDRTGLLIALYRIEFEGWSSEKATAEAKQYGMGFWQYKMKDYINDYQPRRARQDKPTPAQPDETLPPFEY